MDVTKMTLSSRKIKRFENKKRKIQAFLNLIQTEEQSGKKLKLVEDCQGAKEEADLSHSFTERKDTNLETHEKPKSSGNLIQIIDRSPTYRPNNTDTKKCEEVQMLSATSQNDYLQLRRMKRKFTKLKAPCPQIELTEIGDKSLLSLDDNERMPLLMKDVQIALLNLLVPGQFPMPARWARINRKRMISHVVTVVVGGVTIRDLKKCLKSNSKYRHQISATKCNGSIKENDSDGNGLSEDVSDGFTNQDPPLPDWLLHTLPRTSSLFPLSFELTSSFLKVPWEELLYLNSTPMTWNHIIKATKIPSKTKGRLRYEQACRTVVDLTFHDEGVENKTNTERGNSHLADRYDRRQLLLNPSDFYTLKYPAPFNPWYQESGFVFSKDRYEEAKPSSPMFAVDCEMCMTTANQLELTSISVINENLKLIYHKLVKPENEITNYLTQFSGITKSSLENVTTTIHSVHQDLRELLPSDAILVGHSLNCDLKAMKMMHPYIIDTAAVYNVNYIKNKPSSLRTLAKLFLNKDIQMNPHGHDPTEDAVTALELVQLKLSKDIAFGNVLKGSHLHNSEVTNVTHENGQVASLNGKLDFNSLPENLNLFQHAARNRVNTAILVTPNFARVCKEMLDGLPRERVDVHLVTGNKKLSEKAAEISMSKNFTYIQMKVRNLKSCTSRKRKCILTKLDKRLRRIYKGACQKALVMYIFTGSAKNMKSRRHHNGMVMCCIKELEEIS